MHDVCIQEIRVEVSKIIVLVVIVESKQINNQTLHNGTVKNEHTVVEAQGIRLRDIKEN